MSFAEIPTPDEDKWRLRERMLERVQPLKSENKDIGTDSEHSSAGVDLHDRLFRPRPAAPIKRGFASRIRNVLRPLPKGVNDNKGDETALGMGRAIVQGSQAFWNSRTRLAKRLRPYLVRYLRPRLNDIATIPLSLTFFIIPLILVMHFNAAPSASAISVTLITTCLLTNLVFGPRFGTIATLSAFTWLALTIFRPNAGLQLQETLAHWIVLITSGAALAAISVSLGTVFDMSQDLFRLAFKTRAREADINEFQDKLRRAHHSDAILSYIIAYCRDSLKKRAIFLALQDGASQHDEQYSFDIAKQLKSSGFARVIVNRRAYLPRAIQSFSNAGFEAFTLETPSGPVALLGIDVSDGKKLSALDRRYLTLLMTSAAYALERIFLLEKISSLEEANIENKARNAAMMSIVANLTSTTQNLDDQAYGLHQLLEREINRPYDTAIQMIRRNIAALRNSVALLRDVAS